MTNIAILDHPSSLRALINQYFFYITNFQNKLTEHLSLHELYDAAFGISFKSSSKYLYHLWNTGSGYHGILGFMLKC